MELYAFQIDVYGADSYPIVRHTFYGQSKEEAEETFKLHCNADAFLRAAVNQHPFNGVTFRWTFSWKRVPFRDKSSAEC